jgi:hypothetical protein
MAHPAAPIEAPNGDAADPDGSPILRGVPSERRDRLAAEPEEHVSRAPVPIVQLGLDRHALLGNEYLEANGEGGGAIRSALRLVDRA